MANTLKDLRFFVCATAKPDDLDQTEYEALTWVEVGNVGKVGETGTSTNTVSYDELSTDVTQKQKGISNAGDPKIECAFNPTDPGQVLLRAMCLTKFYYAFKTEYPDKPTDDYTNTITYNRGFVTGPVRPNGGNEDFNLEFYTLGLVQQEIIAVPEPGSAPVNVVLPSIVGTQVRVGYTLTAIEGEWTNDPTSWTYQWKHDVSGNGVFSNVSVGGTSRTYVPVVGDIADSVQVVVTAVNGAGSSSGAASLGTIPIIAA